MAALARVSEDGRYREWLEGIGEEAGWRLGPRPYHADDHCVGQTWLDLRALARERSGPGAAGSAPSDDPRIRPVRERFDAILAEPRDGTLEWGTPDVTDRWSWCDSLFMAPPTWARLFAATGEGRYLDFVHRNWKKTSDFLYDPEEHLWFRDSRYFEKREANGRKVFWSRGNGWVFAGLARLLPFVPRDDPERPRYVRQFREMAAKLVEVQGRDGLWRSSLLDPRGYPAPETSGSGFFAFGLAWGIREGILEREAYGAAARSAWEGLVRCVAPDGTLGWVQPIGADPRRIRKTDTEVYGTGAFLLAGSEMLRLAESSEGGRSER
jgi:rhamnogalacturonyl hydrolase YesR